MPKKQRRQPLQFRRKTHALRGREIAGAAATLLLRLGCRSVHVDDVATICGVAKGTCYHHFGSRAKLVKTVVRDLDKALASRLLAVEGALPEPRLRFRNAMLLALDAKLVALNRDKRSKRREASQSPPAWPCCMEVVPCPYGGASDTTHALERLADGLPQMVGHWKIVVVAVLLALPEALAQRHASSRPTPDAIRAIAIELFDRLVAGDAPTTNS